MTSEEKNELKASKLNKTQLSIWDQRLSSIKFPEDVLKAMPQLSQNRRMVERGRYENFKQLAFIISKLSSRMISKMTGIIL
ncbi:hypothetical protein HUG17_9697 [Dermatophagoides farinae]|uniref:Uncharacterized protein n=1 Tax=Dermatophagoides farinae TaxID=6954 RepID=A0A9D4P2K9_DERFA|nr:hypothetical protein HUG17_9697 [Dermatophagoides farinae]